MRVPPGSPLTVQVSAAGFDFRTKPLTFCFEGLTRDGTKTTVAGGTEKFLSQSGDIATFEVRGADRAVFSSMPQGLQGDAMGFDLAGSSFGTSLSVRAIGFDAGKVVVDAAGKLHAFKCHGRDTGRLAGAAHVFRHQRMDDESV